jgi:hypothetical protein
MGAQGRQAPNFWINFYREKERLASAYAEAATIFSRTNSPMI